MIKQLGELRSHVDASGLNSRRWLLAFLTPLLCGAALGQDLAVSFGPAGLEKLSYRDQILEDVHRWPDDSFHIWHMKCLDLSGKSITAGQYGWGENNRGRAWDAVNHRWTYSFVWGTIQVEYLQRGNSLEILVTTTNSIRSNVIVDGASIFPLALHLTGSAVASTLINDGVESPNFTIVQWDNGKVAAIVADAARPLYSGFQAGKKGAYEVIASGTLPDALPAASGSFGRRVKPGESDRFLLTLQFADRSATVKALTGDAVQSWAQRWPPTLHWEDRRTIGTVFLASSPQGEKFKPAGFSLNPRRYFTDPRVDIRSPEGMRHFQQRVLEQARSVVSNLRQLDAQGAITWDIEGEEYPQDTSYACAPDMIGTLAPEMESVITSGAYSGMKLDDAYFKTIRDAGFRVGVCVRPQRFVLAPDGSARQDSLNEGDVAGELLRKMRFAHDRWGATLFYLDSTVHADGTTLPAAIIEQAASAMPDSLLIPEESTPRMYRAAAPFLTFLFHGDTATAPALYEIYPHPFSVNMINDVKPEMLVAHRRELVEAIRRGDILMVHAGYWHANNATVTGLYHEALRH